MIKFNEVTWYSKFTAIICLLGIFPLLTFYIGMQYEKTLTIINDAPVVLAITPKEFTLDNPDYLITWEMATSSNLDYTYPQITNYPHKILMTEVNSAITTTFRGLECDDTEQTSSTSLNIDASVDYTKNNIFSVHISGDYYCGGPYPTVISQTLTYDMNTGKQITFESLFANYTTDKTAIISKIYQDVIVASTTTGDNCEDANTLLNLSENSQDYRISSSPNNLLVTVSYPHVMQACAIETPTPITELLQFTNKASLLHRLRGE